MIICTRQLSCAVVLLVKFCARQTVYCVYRRLVVVVGKRNAVNLYVTFAIFFAKLNVM